MTQTVNIFVPILLVMELFVQVKYYNGTYAINTTEIQPLS